MSEGRVSKKLSLFDTYIKRVETFLLAIVPPALITNGERLGLTTAEETAVTNFRKSWFTGLVATPGAYELHTNPATKTKNTRLAVKNIMKNFTLFFNPLLVRMSGSANITSADRTVLNIAEPNPARTHPREPIADSVYFEAKQKGGGDIRFTCRTSHDTKRASKAKGADVVELAYKIGDPAPASPDDAPQSKTSTRALFILATGASNIGKKLHVYARWSNTKHPEIAGSWSGLSSLMIA